MLLIPESLSWAVKVKMTLFEALVEIPPFIIMFPVGGSKSSLMLFNILWGYSSLQKWSVLQYSRVLFDPECEFA